MLISRLLISGIIVSTLTACGGGSSSSSPNASGEGYRELAMEFVDIQQEYFPNGTPENRTPTARMPANGRATYEGAGAIVFGKSLTEVLSGEDATPQLLGEAKVTADFRKNEISGSVDKFKAAPGNQTTGGNLRLSGNINNTTITGDLKGNVNLNGQNHGFDVPATGEFYGQNANAVAIAGSGRTSRNTKATLSVVAERQGALVSGAAAGPSSADANVAVGAAAGPLK